MLRFIDLRGKMDYKENIVTWNLGGDQTNPIGIEKFGRNPLT